MGSGSGQLERWNTHFSTVVEQEVFGVNLRLAQDPNSEHLGTTVWDASIVLAKFFEKNMRKGELSRPKVSRKAAIELGAGMGLAGLSFALLGADVLLTDTKEVLPLLQRNYDNNISPAALRAAGVDSHVASCGSVRVAELDWSEPGSYCHLPPPDFLLAADCIYHERLTRHLYRTMLALTSMRTTVIIANERRSESVQAAFTGLFSPSFSFKKVPLSKQDPAYSHPLIEVYLLRRKKDASDANLAALEAAEAAEAAGCGSGAALAAAALGRQLSLGGGAEEGCAGEGSKGEGGAGSGGGGDAAAAEQPEQQQQQAPEQQQQQQQQQHQSAAATAADGGGAKQLSWEARRRGSEAARLLAGVAVP